MPMLEKDWCCVFNDGVLCLLDLLPMDGTRLETDDRTTVGVRRDDDRDATDAIFRNAEEEIMVPTEMVWD